MRAAPETTSLNNDFRDLAAWSEGLVLPACHRAAASRPVDVEVSKRLEDDASAPVGWGSGGDLGRQG
jgi:hypothetical protein